MMPGEFPQMPARLCAIVDAYSAGRFLPRALLRHGTQCVHVRSVNPDINLPGNQHGIDVDITHNGDVETIVATLRELGVDYVIAGAESGVMLADVLAAR